MSRRRNRSRPKPKTTTGRSPRGQQTAQPTKKILGFSRRAAAWGAGVLAAALAAALGTWLTGLGNTVANSLNRGPALSAIADILSGPYSYALAEPVTSENDRVTLLSGTASDSALVSLISRHGGAPVRRLDVTLVLQGHRDGLRVIDIVPQETNQPEPSPTAAFLAPPSAGTFANIQVSVDMDQPFPVLQSAGSPYFSRDEIQLANGESTTFQITFTATTGFHVFSLVVTYITDGKQERFTVPGPFDGLFKIAGIATDYRNYHMVYWG
jgi:hypothetical protein